MGVLYEIAGFDTECFYYKKLSFSGYQNLYNFFLLFVQEKRKNFNWSHLMTATSSSVQPASHVKILQNHHPTKSLLVVRTDSENKNSYFT